MTIQCCVCHRVKVEDEWKHQSVERPQEVSHTYCPVCLDASKKAMCDEIARRRAAMLVTA